MDPKERKSISRCTTALMLCMAMLALNLAMLQRAVKAHG
jgi:hypothetical protein